MSAPGSATTRVATPSSAVPTVPGAASPPARPLTVISVSVIPYRSTTWCPVSRSRSWKTGVGSAALPDTSSRAPDSAAAAPGTAAIRDHTVGTPKYRLPPAAAAAAYASGVGRPVCTSRLPVRRAPSTPSTSPWTWNNGSPCTRTSCALHSHAPASASRSATIAPCSAPRPWAHPSCPTCTGSTPGPPPPSHPPAVGERAREHGGRNPPPAAGHPNPAGCDRAPPDPRQAAPAHRAHPPTDRPPPRRPSPTKQSRSPRTPEPAPTRQDLRPPPPQHPERPHTTRHDPRPRRHPPVPENPGKSSQHDNTPQEQEQQQEETTSPHHRATHTTPPYDQPNPVPPHGTTRHTPPGTTARPGTARPCTARPAGLRTALHGLDGRQTRPSTTTGPVVARATGRPGTTRHRTAARPAGPHGSRAPTGTPRKGTSWKPHEP